MSAFVFELFMWPLSLVSSASYETHREILEESQKGIDVNIIGYGGWEVNDIMIPNMISFAVKIRVREQRAV